MLIIVAVIAAFLGYALIRVLISALPFLIIFGILLFAIFEWHLY